MDAGAGVEWGLRVVSRAVNELLGKKYLFNFHSQERVRHFPS